MNIRAIVSLSEKFVADNAPTILTGVGVVGTATTAVLAGKASWQAKGRLDALRRDPVIGHITNAASTEEAMTLQGVFKEHADIIQVSTTDKLKTVLPLYIPPVLVGGATIAAIVFNHKINAQRLAAVAAVYALTNDKAKDYKAKVEELLGMEKKNEIDGAIANDKLAEVSKKKPQIVMIGQDEALIFDIYSGRYFKSTVSRIDAAVNEINAEINLHTYAKLGAFWQAIGLDSALFADDMGFDMENPLEVEFTPHQNENDMPYLMMEYQPVNIRGLVHRGT
jgi:hypothetical protein